MAYRAPGELAHGHTDCLCNDNQVFLSILTTLLCTYHAYKALNLHICAIYSHTVY